MEFCGGGGPQSSASADNRQAELSGAHTNVDDGMMLNSREKWRKCFSVTGSLRGQAQVRPIDKLDEACTNANDQMMLVQHRSGDRVMS